MVAVPLNVDNAPGNILHVLQVAGASALLVSRKQAMRIERQKLEAPCPVMGEEQFSPCPPQTAAQVRPNDLAALMFTSGSTGEPKGVRVTHRNIECNTRDIVGYLGLTAADRALLVLPLHYCFGLSVLHTHLLVGGTVVFNNQFLYPETVLRDIAQYQCTGLAGVPSTYQILLRKSRFKSVPLPTLRWLQQAGGRLPSPCIEELRAAQPQARCFTMYGQTEATARLSYLPPERLADKLGSIGTGLASTRLEVIKPEGQPVQPGSDEVGEIVAAGDNICDGYWNDAEETAKYFRDGKLFTGDLARVDAEGFIHIVDRERDMIKCGGNRVSPKEIEDVIARHPEVVEVAVIGMPDELLGEAIAAFVVVLREATVNADQLLTLCRRELPPYKTPTRIELVDSLPHNSSGKVLKAALRTVSANR
jgi:acyl-CoA synthetase (AMP-forming)/AMP-acid ligase II